MGTGILHSQLHLHDKKWRKVKVVSFIQNVCPCLLPSMDSIEIRLLYAQPAVFK